MKRICSIASLCLLLSVSTAIQSKELKVFTEVALGELVDKITILQIKSERITDPNKLINIMNELNALLESYQQIISPEQRAEIADLVTKLKKINEELWDIEDNIRDKELMQEFDDAFIQLARSVYFTNDARCAVKRNINIACGSRLIEEKSYRDYVKQ